jgi:hypothetical protein
VITNSYGVFIASPTTGGTVTNTPFGIYQQDSNSLNYFAGNVAIGPGTPASTSNSVTLYSSCYQGAKQLVLERTGSNPARWAFSAQANSLIIRDDAQTTDRLTIDSSGAVGIGASSPSTFGSNGSSTRLVLAGASASADTYLYIGTSDGSKRAFVAALGTGTLQIKADEGANGSTPAIKFTVRTTDVLTMSSAGALLPNNIHNNGGTGNASNQAIASGTYSPVLTNSTNTNTLTTGTCQWMRVGNVVTVSGMVTITASSASAGFNMTLPIACTSGPTVGGIGASVGVTAVWSLNSAAATTATLSTVNAYVGPQVVSFTYTYTVN